MFLKSLLLRALDPSATHISCQVRKDPRVFNLLGFDQGAPSSQYMHAWRQLPESFPSRSKTIFRSLVME